MTTLVMGATGATGRLLVEQLLLRGQQVRAIVRSRSKARAALTDHPHLSLVEAEVCDASDRDIADWVHGCEAVASCLGHNLTLKGIFGPPRRLVTQATQRLCRGVMENGSNSPTKFVLMNTAGNSNRDLDEPISFAERCVLGLLRRTIPPHRDNELAADHLRTAIGQINPMLQWVVVRPDTLINETEVSQYDLHQSPTRSAIFNAGKSSRINVAHFMAELICDESTWSRWKGQMPILYNAP
ncbi:hypothetical protein Poly24_33590 [Rosistilla carotiformis]|uniref:NAD(P)-binding domain-containing protein n=1 Tax=Rosistilla carotiformis TaxID=2528017 RepID=A0A518JVT0_9BACT|nr:NAD(P)-binding oxidoreductase [Rosistilla carotiformis]QDV69643.1 hypothetical protein Poly24_33590 [Rosistilla carotiformis]